MPKSGRGQNQLQVEHPGTHPCILQRVYMGLQQCSAIKWIPLNCKRVNLECSAIVGSGHTSCSSPDPGSAVSKNQATSNGALFTIIEYI